MKKLMLLVAVAGFSLAVSAQDATKKEVKSVKKEKTALKKHECTASCKEGAHVYAHGEKGHKCTDACKKA